MRHNQDRKSILRIGIITNIIFGAQEAQNFADFGPFFKKGRNGENRSKSEIRGNFGVTR